MPVPTEKVHPNIKALRLQYLNISFLICKVLGLASAVCNATVRSERLWFTSGLPALTPLQLNYQGTITRSKSCVHKMNQQCVSGRGLSSLQQNVDSGSRRQHVARTVASSTWDKVVGLHHRERKIIFGWAACGVNWVNN